MTLAERVRRALFGVRADYQATFRAPTAQRVLQDLALFCRAHDSTADANPQVAARLDGRREVWLRIQSQLQLSEDELWQLRVSRRPIPTDGDDA